jgi:hypothetical protein
MPEVNITSGVISFPFSSNAFDIHRVARIDAMLIHRLASATKRPGHILRGSVEHRGSVLQIYTKSNEIEAPSSETKGPTRVWFTPSFRLRKVPGRIEFKRVSIDALIQSHASERH